jgi:hypothetical protein
VGKSGKEEAEMVAEKKAEEGAEADVEKGAEMEAEGKAEEEEEEEKEAEEDKTREAQEGLEGKPNGASHGVGATKAKSPSPSALAVSSFAVPWAAQTAKSSWSRVGGA